MSSTLAGLLADAPNMSEATTAVKLALEIHSSGKISLDLSLTAIHFSSLHSNGSEYRIASSSAKLARSCDLG